ncbi:hypothetical protein [Nocardioides insulae]|uniref:hypothetical protein n=1 Tax=Nocardioides insulae TaxID=394734 RepID=UPI00040559CB|nr:hypothetical protein [Nocardioides insulae]
MIDIVFLLLTLACFAGLALLVGLIDRRLPPAEDASPGPTSADPAANPAPHEVRP